MINIKYIVLNFLLLFLILNIIPVEAQFKIPDRELSDSPEDRPNLIKEENITLKGFRDQYNFVKNAYAVKNNNYSARGREIFNRRQGTNNPERGARNNPVQEPSRTPDNNLPANNSRTPINRFKNITSNNPADRDLDPFSFYQTEEYNQRDIRRQAFRKANREVEEEIEQLVVLNKRTGNLGVVSGKLVIRLKNYEDLEAILNDNSVDLALDESSTNFKNIKTVIIQTKNVQSLINLISNLTDNDKIEAVYPEVLENFLEPVIIKRNTSKTIK